MEIMRFIAGHVRDKSKFYYITLTAAGIFTVFLALGRIVNFSDLSSPGLPWTGWDPQWFWYFPWSGTILGIILVWYYYAPIVCDDLDRLRDAFPGEAYRQLYTKYEGWMRQLHFKSDDKSPRFKFAYSFFWGLFLIAYVCGFPLFAIIHCDFQWYLVGIFIVMVLSVTLLNYSSYYICIDFVYFLMRLCKLEREEGLAYVRQYPSSTYGFQALSHAFDTIVLYFLLDSLFCSINLFSFWRIISNEGYMPESGIEYWSFLYVTLFFVLFGLSSWLYIVLVLRIYLHRLHRQWKLRSYKRFEEIYRHARFESSKMNCILDSIERLNQDKVTMGSWEILISLIAVAANLVTTISIFTDWTLMIGS